MTILRVRKKQNNFVILDKTCLTDEKLSWGAKGLHAFLISMPDDWSVRVSHLQQQATNGRDSVRGLLAELQNAGYIQKSHKRDQLSGRFDCAEYLVLESPEKIHMQENTVTENPSAVENPGNPTGWENPSTDNPSTENTTLINNNIINNKKLNNKTAANNMFLEEGGNIQENAAAVSFSPINQNQKKTNQIQLLSKDDALITDKLTLSQHERIDALLETLNVSEKEVLKKEIEFSLLNNKHFTVCGNDFSRKLNAIRGVILRGDWQTPAGMIESPDKPENSAKIEINLLQIELNKAHADLHHFKKLQSALPKEQGTLFDITILQVKNKISEIEKKMADVSVLETA